MSLYTEYVIWENSEGKWTAAEYYSYSTMDDSDPEADSEWDKEYVFDRFAWVSAQHVSERAARAEFDMFITNPGHGGERFSHAKNPETTEELELFAKFFHDPEFEKSYKHNAAVKKAKLKHEALAETLKEAGGYVGRNISAEFGGSVEDIATGVGIFTFYSGLVRRADDGWLSVEGKDFFNIQTGEVAELLRKVRVSKPNYSYRW